MLSELPIQWIVCGIALFVAMQCLMSMATLLRERLQGMLIAHVKRKQIEALKQQRIQELRETIRAKKATATSANEKKAA